MLEIADKGRVISNQKNRILIKTVENYTKLVLPGKQHLIKFTWKSSLAKIKNTILASMGSVAIIKRNISIGGG